MKVLRESLVMFMSCFLTNEASCHSIIERYVTISVNMDKYHYESIAENLSEWPEESLKILEYELDVLKAFHLKLNTLHSQSIVLKKLSNLHNKQGSILDSCRYVIIIN